jgi:hypothetical protein
MTVIRKAIIEIETRTKRTKIEAPDVSASQQAFDAEAKAADKATESVGKATKATEEHSDSLRRFAADVRPPLDEYNRKIDEFNFRSAFAFREAGEGALRFARGVAFMSVSSQDDLKELTQTIALAAGAFDLFSGGIKVAANLTAALGPVGLAIAGVTAAVSIGVIAWRRYTDGVGEAILRAEAMPAAFDKALTNVRERLEQERQRRDSDRDVASVALGSGLTPQEGLRRVESELVRVRAERQRAEQDIDSIKGLFSRASDLESRGGFSTDPSQTQRRRRDIAFAERDPAVQEQIKDAEQRRADALREQTELIKQQNQLQQQQLQEQQKNSSRSNDLGFLPSGFRNSARAAIESTVEAESRQIVQRNQAALNEIVTQFEATAETIKQIGNGVQR